MKYKLIALDLDGTLKNSNNIITPKTKEALMKVQEMGEKIVLASGRPTPGLRYDSKELELEKYGGFLLSYNGARVYDVKNDKSIYEQVLSEEEAILVNNRAKQFNLVPMTYKDYSIISEKADDEYVQVESRICDIEVIQVDDLTLSLPKPIFKLLLTGHPDYVASVIDEFKEPYGEDLSIYRSVPFFVEVMAKGIDKAASLERLVQYLGITKEEVMAFGDGYNDLSMIEYAGLGVAMENAVDGVKERADYITKSNDEDGIAYVLSQYFEGVEF